MTSTKMYWGVLLAALFVFMAGSAFAEEKLASISPQRVLFQHPKFEQVQKQIKGHPEGTDGYGEVDVGVFKS